MSIDNEEYPDFRAGIDEAEEASKRVGFAKTHFFGLKDGESAVLRFLTEPTEWLTADQHSFVPTKPKPDGYTGSWPASMSATCRRDKALRSRFPDCFICDHVRKTIKKKDGTTEVKSSKPQARTWAVALLRETITENGRTVGIRTLMREEAKLDAEGKPTDVIEEVPAIVVVNMAWEGFFAPISGYYRQWGTILNRDVKVTRRGADLDTKYTHIPLDPTPDFDIADPEWAAFFGPMIPNLKKMMFDRATDDYYARYFDTRVVWTPKASGGEAGATADGAPVSEQDKPSGDATADKMASMRDRLLNRTTA